MGYLTIARKLASIARNNDKQDLATAFAMVDGLDSQSKINADIESELEYQSFCDEVLLSA